jgi:hypothetical protein
MVIFLTVGTIFILSGPSNAENPGFIYQLLNQRKYPASQLYLLMTLGPTIFIMGPR